METYEWALVLFTVLSQAAMGGFVLTLWLRLRNKDAAMDVVYRKVNLVLCAISVVSLLASLFHLGRPMLAPYAIGNLGSSWLSREVLLAGGFVGLLVLSVLFEKSPSIRQVVDWLAALAGIGAVASMATVYAVTIIPAWQGVNTYVAFFGTAAFLGAALAASLVLVFGSGKESVAANLQLLIWVAVAAVVVQMVVLPFYLAGLAGGGAAGQSTAAMLAGEYGQVLILRWALALVGGLVPFLVAGRRLTAGQVPAGLVYVAVAAVLVGEIVGRYLFYATGTPIGIG
ncbi:MAG TPA: DmsC/YnfH family molybdoenzyme membrane anchor subunit [Symbiobacteriaceae bacterium]|nr:DmsC/YnfH family molybdoenzyme membrane anchor subunit [Symbiobacteriaceae bacterium]